MRSFFTTIAEERIKSFGHHPLFLKLVQYKWSRFALKKHMLLRVIPFLLSLIVLVALLLLQGSESGSMQDGNALAGCSSGHLDISAGYGIDFALLLTTLCFCSAVWFLYQAWEYVWYFRNRVSNDYTQQELVSGRTMNLFYQLRQSAFNNLVLILDLGSAACLITGGISRLLSDKYTEVAAFSVCSILMFCNFLNCFLAFRPLAEMIITTYNMLFGDVTCFLTIFVIILSGFSFAVNALFDKPPTPEMNFDPSTIGGAYMLIVSVGLANGITEVQQYSQSALLPELANSVLVCWVVLCNVLLMNLLIAMLNNTYSKRDDTYESWIFPLARLILDYEKLFSESEKANPLFKLGQQR